MSNHYADSPEVVQVIRDNIHDPRSQKFTYQGLAQDGESPVPPKIEKLSKKICGIALLPCVVILVLLVLLIGAGKILSCQTRTLLAPIGGGVGGSLAVQSCNNKLNILKQSASSATTAMTTATKTTTTATTTTTTIPVTNCSTSSFTDSYTSIQGKTFLKSCDKDYVSSDIIGTVVNSWDLCMEACGTLDTYNASSSMSCVGVTFVPSWIIESYALSNISFWANCFVKYSVPSDLSSVINTHNFEIVVSTLVS